MSQADAVLENLVRFVRLLRASGLPVSPGEAGDGLRAAALCGFDDPLLLHAGLQTAFVKRTGDQAIFDELFAVHFLSRASAAGPGELPLRERLVEEGLDPQAVARLMAQLLDRAADEAALTRLALGLEQSSLSRLFERAAQEAGGLEPAAMANPLAVGMLMQRLHARLGTWQAERAARTLAADLAGVLPEEEARALQHAVAESVARLMEGIRELAAEESARLLAPARQRFRRETLQEKAFAGATEADLKKLRAEVVRLGRRLRGARRPRRERSRTGPLDPHATTRRAMATEGVPIELFRVRRRRDRPRIVALCDVSDSVRHVSRFFLTLAHTLQNEVVQVRSFVFVAGVAEVSALFRQATVDRAVELAHQGRGARGEALLEVLVGSDFGASFEAFARRHLDALTPKTTLLVIGDGRSNYSAPRVEMLARMRARARRLVWLCPEGSSSWGLGDSAMPSYAPLCDEVHVVSNIASLARAVDRLLVK